MRHSGLYLLVLLCVAGCNSSKRFSDEPPDFRQLGTLPGLAKSADPTLQDDFARLQAEEATPAQLAAREKGLPPWASLRKALPPVQVKGALEDIAKIYPTGKFEWGGPELQRARDLVVRDQKLIAAAHAAWQSNGQRIPIDHGQGLLGDLHLVSAVELAGRSDGLEAAAALTDGNIQTAFEMALRMLERAQQVALAPHIVPRLKAAQLRLEALRVIEAVLQDREATPEMAARFHKMLSAQIAAWPDDSAAWIGDRSCGLHTYEMIRRGLVLSVFSEKELSELRAGAGATATARAIQHDVDADERYYLVTMRSLIDCCQQPYWERRERLDQMSEELQQNQSGPHFPLVAARILLIGIDEAMRQQARDRAACEGWLLALSLATGKEPPSFDCNPQTGRAYHIEQEQQRVIVRHARAGEPDEAIVVPRFR
jgi:hypothetical protein